MARLESNHGRLLVSFQFNGVRCREYLGLDDNRDNRRTAARTVNEIECELQGGQVRLRGPIPGEPRGLSISGQRRRHRRPAPMPVEEKPEVPIAWQIR